jgi:hypothetical protein
VITIAFAALNPLTAAALPEFDTVITHLRDILGNPTHESLPARVFDDYCRDIRPHLRPNRPCSNRIGRCLEIDHLRESQNFVSQMARRYDGHR